MSCKFKQGKTVCHQKTQPDLCKDNSDICRLHTGTYTDHDAIVKKWWAFEPIGTYACPDEGCPLYVWIYGTTQAPYETIPNQFFMMEMVRYCHVHRAHIDWNSFESLFSPSHFYSNVACHWFTLSFSIVRPIRIISAQTWLRRSPCRIRRLSQRLLRWLLRKLVIWCSRF